MHRVGAGHEGLRPDGRRILLWLQHGPQRDQGFCTDPIVDRCFSRHGKDYAALSATPDQFQAFVEAVELIMKTEPTYAVQDLPNIQAPVANVQSEHGEFIRQEHAEYLLTHSRSGIHPPARREPFRTAATAGAIQSCDARLPWQVSCLRGLLDIIPFRANLMVMGIAISPRGVMPSIAFQQTDVNGGTRHVFDHDHFTRQIGTAGGNTRMPVLIDVRIDEDYTLDPRLIPGSRRRSHKDIETWMPELVGKRAIIICQQGKKLSEGTAALLRYNVIPAETLDGGFEAWAAAGLPLVPVSHLPARDQKGRTIWVTRARPKMTG